MRIESLLSVLFPLILMAAIFRLSPPAQPRPSSQPEVPSVFDPQEDAMEREVEQGVKHALVSQTEAWNHGNLEGFMQGYWRSPDLTFYSGATVTKGWEATLERYRQRYKSEGKEMGHLVFGDLNIDVLGPKAAAVTGSWQLTMSDGKQPHGLFTLIVKKMPGGWKIVHDHTSAAE